MAGVPPQVWDRGATKLGRAKEAAIADAGIGRGVQGAEEHRSAPSLGCESADPALGLSSLLSPRCAMLSVSDQD